GIAAKSSQQELAKKAMKLILSEDFMTQLAEDSGLGAGGTRHSRRPSPTGSCPPSRVFAQDSIAPELADVTGVMALPPAEAGGESHQFLGGSNVGIAAKSSQQELAKKAMKLILSEDFMTQLAEDSG
ncbi:hypothetical protein CTI14_49345, partial [Methylobacterium radiotolerans]